MTVNKGPVGLSVGMRRVTRVALAAAAVGTRVPSLTATLWSPLTRSLASTVSSVVQTNVALRGDVEVFKSLPQQVTWDAIRIQKHSDAFAKGLIELGYKKSSKIALWMTNEVETLVAQLAAARIGVIIVSIDPALSITAVESIIKSEGVRGLVYSERYAGTSRTAAVQSLLPELEDTLRGDVFVSKRFRALKDIITTGFEEEDNIFLFGEISVYNDDEKVFRPFTPAEDDVVFIPYTPGSSVDTPVKGKELTNKQLYASATSAASSLKLGVDDVLVLTAPLSSPTGFAQGALAAYVAGSQVIIPSKEFDKDASLKAIDEYFASAIVGAPGQTVTPTGKQLKSL